MSTENVDETATQDPPPAEDQTLTTAEPAEPAGEPDGSEGARQQASARMISTDVLVRELTPLRARNRELENALNEHRRQISEANELIRRLQGNVQETQPHAQPNVPIDQDVEQRALALNFQRDVRRVSEAGMAAYGQQTWDSACRLMDGLGLNSPDFVATVMEVAGRERTHEVFQTIAEDPERAAHLAGMTPMRRIAEISRISEQMTPKSQGSLAAGKSPPRMVSRAPDPAPRINTGTRTAKDWRNDDVSDEEFSRRWDEHMRSRHSGVRR